MCGDVRADFPRSSSGWTAEECLAGGEISAVGEKGTWRTLCSHEQKIIHPNRVFCLATFVMYSIHIYVFFKVPDGSPFFCVIFKGGGGRERGGC